MAPLRSYIISCTPRSGSHLLADGLGATGLAGHPAERFPRIANEGSLTPAQRDALVTQPPPEDSYDERQDAEYIRQVIALGTSGNGVFGLTLHQFQVNDAVRRIQSYLGSSGRTPHEVFSSAFPGLSYIWLRRRDKVAQAVSWFKAIETGRYVHVRGASESGPGGRPAAPLQFDYPRIKTYLAALRSSENAWEHFFRTNELVPFTVYYEDLAASYDRTLRQALAFLGLPHEGIVLGAPRHAKAADEHSFEWIARFKAMHAARRQRAPAS